MSTALAPLHLLLFGETLADNGIHSASRPPRECHTNPYAFHYPIEGGAFWAACEQLLTKDFRISWADRFPARHVAARVLEAAQARDMPVAGIVAPDEALTSKPTRMKYTCITCKTNVWGKPGLKLGCGECGDAYRVNTR
ncbi:hypothetical protein [Candidatus Glomeribacter gigasporarum]|uniref:hypothetical protein n=1 Tax=Candidatus Glomeribacter gigasporarum TaxID=132144 RepID=UPI00031E177F|nr:hypothetical protein [Candidatus Glomeribacter gigasporarum]